MDFNITLLFPAFFALLANMTFQVVTHRWGFLGYVQSIVLGFAFGLLVLAGIETFLFSTQGFTADRVALFVGDGSLYVCAGYLFFQLANIGESSIRFRIIREYRAAGREMSFEELTARYNDTGIISGRIARLERNGKLRKTDDRYVIVDSSLLRMHAILRFLKKFLLGKSSEFE